MPFPAQAVSDRSPCALVSSKLAIVPTWLRFNDTGEMHQPQLLSGKLSYLVCFALDLFFMSTAVRNLSGFLRPAGAILPAAQAYKMPLKVPSFERPLF